MTKVTGPSNHHTRKLIRDLWKTKRRIWRRTSEIIGKPARNRVEINLFRLNKITKDNDIVLIPGKILGSGNMDHSITCASLNISTLAEEKLKNAKCSVLSIHELMEKYPTGSGIRLLV